MQYPFHYADLVSSDIKLSPPPLVMHGLGRVGQPTQFFDNLGIERLAVPELLPYGLRTEESIAPGGRLGSPRAHDLLALTDIGEDYSVFEVPEDLFTISAISLGTGNRHTEDLEPLYENVGKVVGLNAREFTMRNIGMSSLAFLRDRGQVVFIPPFHFQRGKINEGRIKQNLSHSINTSLYPVFHEDRINALIQRTFEGFDDGRRSTE